MSRKFGNVRVAMQRVFGSTFILPALLVVMLAAPPRSMAGASMAVSHELDLELGYAGRAVTLQDGRHVGSIDELATDVKYVISPQITDNLLLRVGAEWERFAFDTSPTGALPDILQHASAVVGFDYQLADQWLMRTEIQPGIYGSLAQIGWRNVDAPLFMGAVYLKDADLQWFFGLRIDLRSQYPVFPALGVRWKFTDVWTLNFQLPKPRLEYDVNDDLQAYLGAGVKAGTFVVGEHFGDNHGIPALNNATVDYTDVHLGPGFAWKVLPTLTLEAEGGYMVYRAWDFFDKHVKLDSHPAPYFQLSCHARF
ncbi:hypothetical protein F6V25_15465 [Oryzomonas japonica]|uniref:DUF6268 domain-containing protein n=1 Tax=Oryzomonas japonica TaxID=2603858 RepID=A0A7J4ZMD3_9BACT|nr:DUF6268 family outer membrane beta-barrel protein [Oryzomonas japonica]KAB0663826.1 hypothetical protein F6V25_15465 [Oryzomonas japonica]